MDACPLVPYEDPDSDPGEPTMREASPQSGESETCATMTPNASLAAGGGWGEWDLFFAWGIVLCLCLFFGYLLAFGYLLVIGLPVFLCFQLYSPRGSSLVLSQALQAELDGC